MRENAVTTRQKQRSSRSFLAKVKRFLDCTTETEVEEQHDTGKQTTTPKRDMEVCRQGSPAASYTSWGSVRNSSTSENENLKILFSVLIAFFLSVFFLEGQVNGLGFYLIILFVGVLLWNLKNASVGLYRMLLAACLVIILNSSLGRPLGFLPEPSSLIEDSSKGTYVEVRSSEAEIREAPGNDSRVVFTAQRGDELRVIDKRGSWYKVRTWSGTSGWVRASSVS